MRWVPLGLVLLLLVPAGSVPTALGQETRELSESVQMKALAVARTEGGGTVGTAATISVSVTKNGTGGVFLDTKPLAGTDMQGSARIAARVASSLTGFAFEEHDFYFVVRSDSPVISGPSAGSVMGLAATVALENLHRGPGEENWTISDDVLVTGTITPDRSIGPVGGILEKARAAASRGAELFLVPEGQGTYTPRDNGQLAGSGEAVDVPTYCRSELGITCREVGQLDELVRLATGHRFVEPELGEPPTTAGYEETLSPLADELIERARLYERVWAQLNRSHVAPEPAREIVSVLEEARSGVAQARDNVDESRYYSAASRAFQAAIAARHAELLLEYHDQGQDPSVVDEAIREARNEVDRAREAAGEANVTGIQTFYTVGAAQKRVSDAEQRVRDAERAWNGSQGPRPSPALQAAARAVERSATVHWWLELGDEFGPGPQMPVEPAQLAQEMMDLGNEMLAYTSQVLGGRQPSEAARSLQQAQRNDQRGFHAGAAIEAAEAQVSSALTLEIGPGSLTEDKIDASRDAAILAIQKARGEGVEPILPIALFEFGGVQENAGLELQFYRTARVLAGMTNTLGPDAGPTETEFVGPWDAEEHNPPTGHSYRSVAVGWFVVGVFWTAVLAILTGALVGRRDGLG